MSYKNSCVCFRFCESLVTNQDNVIVIIELLHEILLGNRGNTVRPNDDANDSNFTASITKTINNERCKYYRNVFQYICERHALNIIA